MNKALLICGIMLLLFSGVILSWVGWHSAKYPSEVDRALGPIYRPHLKHYCIAFALAFVGIVLLFFVRWYAGLLGFAVPPVVFIVFALLFGKADYS